MEEQAKPKFDYVRFARRLLRKRWWIIAGLFFLVVIPGAVLIYSTAPRLYEATAVLFFEELKEQHPLLRGMTPPEASALSLAILQSRSLAQAVVDVLPRESKEDLPQRSVAAEYIGRAQNAVRRLLGQEVVVYSPHQQTLTTLLQARMNFTVLKDGRVIIAADAFSPRVATDLANTYVDVLLARTGSQARDQARAVREMLDNLLLQTKAGLGQSEDALRRSRGNGGDGVAVTDQSRLELTRLAELESQLQENQVNQEIARGRLGFLRGESQKAGSKTLAPVPRANDPVQILRERQSELETKLAGLSEKYTDKHPLVIATRAEVEEAQDKLRLALKGQQDPRPGGSVVLGPAERAALSKQMADLEVELATLAAREASLTQRVERGRRALSVTSGRELEYTKLMRAVENQRNLFNLYAERISEVRMSEQSQIRNIRVIDLATMPAAPSTKPMLKMLLVVLMAGLGLGLGVATLLEYVQEVVETEEDVVRITGLPVLGSIPIVPVKRASAGSRTDPLNFRQVTSSASLALEASRAVATSLELRDMDGSLKTIMITSASAGDGKTTTLLNLGEAMAETERRVLLIDADLRRPALHRALRMPNEVGLSDVLGPGEVGIDEACRRLDDWLAVVPAGAKPENPGALLGSRQVKTLLEIARARADMVLFDSAPVMAVSDNLHLASLVDGVVLVVRSGVTQRRSLARAKTRLDKASARVVGVIVNGLSPRDARHYYSEYTAYVSGPQYEAKGGKRWLGFWPLKRKGSGS